MQITKVYDGAYNYIHTINFDCRTESICGRFTRCSIVEMTNIENKDMIYVNMHHESGQLFTGIDTGCHIKKLDFKEQQEFMNLVENEYICKSTWDHFCKKYNTDSTPMNKTFIATIKKYLNDTNCAVNKENKKAVVLRTFDYMRDNKQELFKDSTFAYTCFKKIKCLLGEGKQDVEWCDKLKVFNNELFGDFIAYIADSVLRSSLDQ